MKNIPSFHSMRHQVFMLILMLIFGLSTKAQEGKCPKLPATYAWEEAGDYEKDRDLVKKVLKWLCVTPLGIDIQQRSVANVFVLEWLAGVPSVTVELKTDHLPFMEKNPDLLFSFLHGMALYKMDHPDEKNDVTLYTKGFETVAALATQSKELSHEHELRPMVKAYKKQKVKAYTKEILAKK